MGERNEEAMEQDLFLQLIAVFMLDLWILRLHAAIPTTLRSPYRWDASARMQLEPHLSWVSPANSWDRLGQHRLNRVGYLHVVQGNTEGCRKQSIFGHFQSHCCVTPLVVETTQSIGLDNCDFVFFIYFAGDGVRI